jgi:ankyrin repeat protein
MSNQSPEYDLIYWPLVEGDIPRLTELALKLGQFARRQDDFIERHWIRNAIDSGTLEVVRWLLAEGAPTVFVDEAGYSVLHSAIERTLPDKHEILRTLIDAGADLNAYGFNGWTPLHLAAARNDVDSLRILRDAGADLSIRTKIILGEEQETPLEVALACDAKDAIVFLRAATP